MKKSLSLALSLIMTASVFMQSVGFAATTALTEAELKALETPLLVVASDSNLPASRVEITPSKYRFKVASGDDKEYILLKNVNENVSNKTGDVYFVMTEGYTQKGVAYDTNYTMSTTNQKGNKTAEATKFDAKRENSLANAINTDSYIAQHFPTMKDYIKTNTWYTEAGYELDAYSTDAKIALLSVTEYAQNADRISLKPKGETLQWWLRSPHIQENANYAVWEFLTSGKIAHAWNIISTYSGRVVRPCFYLDETFFDNVKIDEAYLSDDAEVTKIIKSFDIEKLRSIGYSDALLVKWGLLKGSTEMTGLTITGDTQVGCTLKAEYVIPDGFEEEEYTRVSWEYSSSPESGFEEITKYANKKEILIDDTNLNEKYMRVKVTLGNIDGTKTYTSDAVYIKTLPPAICDAVISGSLYTGEELSVNYDIVSGAPDVNKTVVSWFWGDTADTATNLIKEEAGENGKKYTVSYDYGNKYIRAEVTPVNAYGIGGETIESESVYIIATVNPDDIETPLTIVNSTATITAMGKEILDTLSPAQYTFKIDEDVKTADGKGDTKEYVLLKNVNAKDGDGYFVMVSDGAKATSDASTASYALKQVYPGVYSGEDASIIAKNYESPTRTFDAQNVKSLAYYLNQESYIKTHFPIMHEGNYIKDHTWYTEATTAEPAEKAYATTCKIALPSTTEYIANIDRIGTKTNDVTWTPTIFGTRTPHPTVLTKAHTSNTYTAPAMWYVTSNKALAGESLIYIWQTLERPCFYLSEDFFRNVKITAKENSALADVLKELMTYSEMKALGYTDEELNKMGISTEYPTGSNASVNGNYMAGNMIYADYDFSHTDSLVGEGVTAYQWYVEENGVFNAVLGATDRQYVIKDSDVGKKIKVEITPYDENGYKADTISAVSYSPASARENLVFKNVSIGNIESMSGVTSVNAEVTVDALSAKNVNLYVGVYNKKTNQCVALGKSANVEITAGVDAYQVSTETFTASDDNYIKVFALDTQNRPLFGIDYFRR